MNLRKQICYAALILTFIVIALGAYVRLSDAGLGCPDWPGCYGKWVVDQSIDSGGFIKAWKEMIHRYFAGTLSLLILALFILTIKLRRKIHKNQLKIVSALMGVLVFQALLGMWTVTLKLHPLVVTAHLIGGMTTFGILVWFSLNLTNNNPNTRSRSPLALFCLGLIALQIFLGGLTSSNYAALACPDFPMCRGVWWPGIHWGELISAWSRFDVSHEYGLVGDSGRVSLQLLHRMGAILVFSFSWILGVRLICKNKTNLLGKLGFLLCALVTLQVCLGVATVYMVRPLWIAVLHNIGATFLLGTSFVIVYYSQKLNFSPNACNSSDDPLKGAAHATLSRFN